MKALKDIRGGSVNILKQIKSITAANLGNSRSTVALVGKVKGLQEISKKNVEEAKKVQGILGKQRAPKASAKNRNGGN